MKNLFFFIFLALSTISFSQNCNCVGATSLRKITGTANPNGNVSGIPGEIYQQRITQTTGTFWVKKTGNDTKAGWVEMGSGGGSSVNAKNGVHLQGDTVKCGGPLEETTILVTPVNTGLVIAKDSSNFLTPEWRGFLSGRFDLGNPLQIVYGVADYVQLKSKLNGGFVSDNSQLNFDCNFTDDGTGEFNSQARIFMEVKHVDTTGGQHVISESGFTINPYDINETVVGYQGQHANCDLDTTHLTLAYHNAADDTIYKWIVGDKGIQGESGNSGNFSMGNEYESLPIHHAVMYNESYMGRSGVFTLDASGLGGSPSVTNVGLLPKDDFGNSDSACAFFNSQFDPVNNISYCFLNARNRDMVGSHVMVRSGYGVNFSDRSTYSYTFPKNGANYGQVLTSAADGVANDSLEWRDLFYHNFGSGIATALFNQNIPSVIGNMDAIGITKVDTPNFTSATISIGDLSGIQGSKTAVIITSQGLSTEAHGVIIVDTADVNISSTGTGSFQTDGDFTINSQEQAVISCSEFFVNSRSGATINDPSYISLNIDTGNGTNFIVQATGIYAVSSGSREIFNFDTTNVFSFNDINGNRVFQIDAPNKSSKFTYYGGDDVFEQYAGGSYSDHYIRGVIGDAANFHFYNNRFDFQQGTFTIGNLAGNGNGVVGVDNNGLLSWQPTPTGVQATGQKSQALVAATTITVTFGGTQPDTNYQVFTQATTNILAVGGIVGNKTTTTFDYILPVTTGTVSFDWSLIR